MGRWREQLLLVALTGLAPLSTALEITSTFTTVFPTTAVVTSSSEIPGCTVASSMQIACSNGYYNTYGAVWQETCAASFSGGILILSSTGLSLRACTSACAVRPACSAASFNSAINMCYLFQGDVTITPGGPYQAAMRYAPSASPCVSTWLVTETDTVTSTGKVVYTLTSTSTPTPYTTGTPSSTPVSPSSTPISPSSVRVSSSSSPVPLSSVPVSPSSTPSSTPLIGSSIPPSSSLSSSPVSSPVRPSSTPLIRTSVTSSVSTDSPSVIPSASSSFFFSTPSSSSGPSLTGSSLGSSSSASSLPSLSLSPSISSSVPAASSDVSASGPNASTTQPTASSTALATVTVTPSALTQSSEGSSGNTPSASTYTVTTTQVQTITSCAAAVTNCPSHQQTTYLTTEIITYVTTVCPEGSPTTAPQATVSVTTIPHTSVIQTASVSSAQSTKTAASPSHMTTSTVYVTEIDVVTACPPSVNNCPARQRSTYTTTKTVASYTTAYLAAVTESALVSQSMTTSVQPVVVSTLSPAQPHVFGQGASGNHTMPHTLSSSSWKSGIASSGSTQAATQATEINTVSGKTISSVTASASGSLFTGDAHKMGHSSILFPMAALLSALLFF